MGRARRPYPVVSAPRYKNASCKIGFTLCGTQLCNALTTGTPMVRSTNHRQLPTQPTALAILQGAPRLSELFLAAFVSISLKLPQIQRIEDFLHQNITIGNSRSRIIHGLDFQRCDGSSLSSQARCQASGSQNIHTALNSCRH